MLWKAIGIEFGEFLVSFAFVIWGATEVIRTIKGKETATMAFLSKILSLIKYLLRELRTGNFSQRMNAMLAVMIFLFFLGAFAMLLMEYYNKSLFSEKFFVICVLSILSFAIAMFVCEKFTRPRYPYRD